jgi:hypothetical protein
MLETLVRSQRKRCLTTLFLGAAATLFCSCATEKPRTALINDPDAQKESSIPWNKPAKWESGAQVPGGFGGGVGGGINGSPGTDY